MGKTYTAGFEKFKDLLKDLEKSIVEGVSVELRNHSEETKRRTSMRMGQQETLLEGLIQKFEEGQKRQEDREAEQLQMQKQGALTLMAKKALDTSASNFDEEGNIDEPASPDDA